MQTALAQVAALAEVAAAVSLAAVSSAAPKPPALRDSGVRIRQRDLKLVEKVVEVAAVVRVAAQKMRQKSEAS